jgi:hypothetical protein
MPRRKSPIFKLPVLIQFQVAADTLQENHTMQSPLTDADTLFEQLWQDLPPETVHLAREFKAFVRAKKVKTPEQLLRVVFLYCG